MKNGGNLLERGGVGLSPPKPELSLLIFKWEMWRWVSEWAGKGFSKSPHRPFSLSLTRCLDFSHCIIPLFCVRWKNINWILFNPMAVSWKLMEFLRMHRVLYEHWSKMWRRYITSENFAVLLIMNHQPAPIEALSILINHKTSTIHWFSHRKSNHVLVMQSNIELVEMGRLIYGAPRSIDFLRDLLDVGLAT